MAITVDRIHHANLMIANRATETVAKVTVRLGPQSFEITELKSGESRGGKFRIAEDRQYLVDVAFHDGKTLQKPFSLLTKGTDLFQVLVISADDINLLDAMISI